jgi:hypothetical protein
MACQPNHSISLHPFLRLSRYSNLWTTATVCPRFEAVCDNMNAVYDCNSKQQLTWASGALQQPSATSRKHAEGL